MSQRWSAIFCATGAWGGKPIGRVRVKIVYSETIKKFIFILRWIILYLTDFCTEVKYIIIIILAFCQEHIPIVNYHFRCLRFSKPSHPREIWSHPRCFSEFKFDDFNYLFVLKFSFMYSYTSIKLVFLALKSESSSFIIFNSKSERFSTFTSNPQFFTRSPSILTFIRLRNKNLLKLK